MGRGFKRRRMNTLQTITDMVLQTLSGGSERRAPLHGECETYHATHV